jgi:hypothetical protein
MEQLTLVSSNEATEGSSKKANKIKIPKKKKEKENDDGVGSFYNYGISKSCSYCKIRQCCTNLSHLRL